MTKASLGVWGVVETQWDVLTIFWWKAVQLQARVQQMVPEEAAGSKKEVKTFPFNPVTLTKGLGCNMAKSHTMPRLCMVGTCNGEKKCSSAVLVLSKFH